MNYCKQIYWIMGSIPHFWRGIWRVEMCWARSNNFQDILSLLRQDSDSGSDSNLWSDSDSRFESLKKRIFDKLNALFYFTDHIRAYSEPGEKGYQVCFIPWWPGGGPQEDDRISAELFNAQDLDRHEWSENFLRCHSNIKVRQAPVVQNLAMWVLILSLWVLIKFDFWWTQ